MSTVPAQLPVSIDRYGLSVFTSTRDFDNLDRGYAWGLPSLSAGVPVHFHQLPDGRWLMLLARRWTQGVVEVEPTGPQDYSSYVEETDPAWFPLSLSGGALRGSPAVQPIPSAVPGTRELTGAASHGQYLYVVSRVTDGDVVSGLLQHFHAVVYGNINLVGEERVPTIAVGGGQQVIFDRGAEVLGIHVVVPGVNADNNQVFLTRKLWARVGTGPDSFPWEYHGSSGWGQAEDIAPLRHNGQAIVSHGPVGLSRYGTRIILSVVQYAEGSYSGVCYSSDIYGLSSWERVGDPIPLGGDTTYLSGTVWLQNQVGSNPQVVAGRRVLALPYVYSTLVSAESQSRIANVWGIFEVPRDY